MSDAEKRQSRQRALTVGACAAVFAFGGPLIAQRFSLQKAEEAYRADAIVLAQSIQAEGQAPVQLVSFTNKASPDALVHKAAYTADAPASDILGGLSLRAQDNLALRGLVSFTFENLGLGKSEQDELTCLSQAVYYEARSEDTIGQMAVAEVVMNRVRDSRFPKTVCDVVFQGQYRDTGCQFTFTCDGSIADKPRGEAWDRAKDVALHVALGLNKPVTNKATHYHTDYVNPYWKAGMVETAAIGTHIFYRFPKTSTEWTTARVNLAAQQQHDDGGLITVDALPQDAAPIIPDAGATLITISTKPAETPAPIPATQVADARPL